MHCCFGLFKKSLQATGASYSLWELNIAHNIDKLFSYIITEFNVSFKSSKMMQLKSKVQLNGQER